MAYNLNQNKPQNFKGRKEEILNKMSGKLARLEAAKAIAQQIKEAIKANDGKCYNVKFDRQLEAIADKANASGQTGRGYVTTSVKCKRNYGNGHYYLEIEICNNASRYSYQDYESYFLRVDVTDYTRGRIQAETLEDPDTNATNTREIENAIENFDEAADLYAKLCEVADKINETPYLLRAEMSEGVYISGIQNR